MSRYVCAACGGWCELLTELIHVPWKCPMGCDEFIEWEELYELEDEDEEE